MSGYTSVTKCTKRLNFKQLKWALHAIKQVWVSPFSFSWYCKHLKTWFNKNTTDIRDVPSSKKTHLCCLDLFQPGCDAAFGAVKTDNQVIIDYRTLHLLTELSILSRFKIQNCQSFINREIFQNTWIWQSYLVWHGHILSRRCRIVDFSSSLVREFAVGTLCSHSQHIRSNLFGACRNAIRFISLGKLNVSLVHGETIRRGSGNQAICFKIDE